MVTNSINGIFHFVRPLITLMHRHGPGQSVGIAAVTVKCFPTHTLTHFLCNARVPGLWLAFSVGNCHLPVTLSWQKCLIGLQPLFSPSAVMNTVSAGSFWGAGGGVRLLCLAVGFSLGSAGLAWVEGISEIG